jgi:hypothetical protein
MTTFSAGNFHLVFAEAEGLAAGLAESVVEGEEEGEEEELVEVEEVLDSDLTLCL